MVIDGNPHLIISQATSPHAAVKAKYTLRKMIFIDIKNDVLIITQMTAKTEQI
jgi:hypothetical protein